jgi:MerR family transcriptional regulator, light-induced transcriptional regulator
MTAPLPRTPGSKKGAALTRSISDVERETGLGKDTLRVWERRYGFPVPLRDALGERAYPQAQVQRLRLIKRLMDAGFRPGKVVALAPKDLLALLSNTSSAQVGARPKGKRDLVLSSSPDPKVHPLEDAAPWLQWLAQDQTDMIRQALQKKIKVHGLLTVVNAWVAPLCKLVGESWMRGDISVYQEHLFTEMLQSLLREAIAAVDARKSARKSPPRVLLTTTPGEQHGLGLLMAECHFALSSCTRFMLGTSTPLVDIVQAVQQLRIDVLALSFSAYATRRDVVENLQNLRAQLPTSVQIWVGGGGAAAHNRELPAGVLLLRQSADVAPSIRGWKQHKQLESAGGGG